MEIPAQTQFGVLTILLSLQRLLQPDSVAYTCNSSYSGDEDQEDLD
jgi:hypothetical protein